MWSARRFCCSNRDIIVEGRGRQRFLFSVPICKIYCQNIRLRADKKLRKQREIKFTHIWVKTKKEVITAKLVLFSPEILGISIKFS